MLTTKVFSKSVSLGTTRISLGIRVKGNDPDLKNTTNTQNPRNFGGWEWRRRYKEHVRSDRSSSSRKDGW